VMWLGRFLSQPIIDLPMCRGNVHLVIGPGAKNTYVTGHCNRPVKRIPR
jgi:hypothetical protein